MNEIKLLPCPFCGEELEVVGNGHYFAHKINGCILQHLCFETDDKEGIESMEHTKANARDCGEVGRIPKGYTKYEPIV